MTAPTAPSPTRPAPVVPGECEALRDGAKCRAKARLYPSGWRCHQCRPGAPPPQQAQAA